MVFNNSHKTFLIEKNIKKNKNLQEDQSDPEDYAYLTDIIGCVVIDEPTNKINCLICDYKYSSLKNQEIKKHLSTKHSYLWNELEKRKNEFLKIEYTDRAPLEKQYSIYLKEKDKNFIDILVKEHLIYFKKDNNKFEKKYLINSKKNDKIHNTNRRKNIKNNYHLDKSNINNVIDNNNNNHIYICENVKLIIKNNIQITSKKIVIK
ncbi:2703_t:CDS:1 [Scutellospora calospora]|uniref:2703_t:CDS:1 n=1 Tax=Scutellospora calospora TaxID=85575 RepID=A0ACA9LHW9_9GLOM|nr:2703_t:CDS:1 [Scutellospora calospora]